MTVYEIIAWHFEAESKGLWRTESRVKEEARKMVESGDLIHPLYSIVVREVQE